MQKLIDGEKLCRWSGCLYSAKLHCGTECVQPDAVDQNEPCYGLRLIAKAQEMADYLRSLRADHACRPGFFLINNVVHSQSIAV